MNQRPILFQPVTSSTFTKVQRPKSSVIFHNFVSIIRPAPSSQTVVPTIFKMTSTPLNQTRSHKCLLVKNYATVSVLATWRLAAMLRLSRACTISFRLILVWVFKGNVQHYAIPLMVVMLVVPLEQYYLRLFNFSKDYSNWTAPFYGIHCSFYSTITPP